MEENIIHVMANKALSDYPTRGNNQLKNFRWHSRATSEPKGKQEIQAIETQGLILMSRDRNLGFPGPKALNWGKHKG